jgi:nonribosomal peptide synthetase MxcG
VDPVPIGRPLPGVQAFVQAQDGKPARNGEIGELLIGGKGLARGYWRAPQQTSAKFIRLPKARRKARRWYRTGDMVQQDQNGDLIFLGRRDDQVKILGHRIELAEVEAALRACAGIREAAVIAAEADGFSGLLAAVSVSGPKPPEAELRATLFARLPAVMVPRHIMILDQLPVGAGGKLDRAAMLKRFLPQNTLAPQMSVEEVVARKFAEALECPTISVEDDFFELGGDSLATVEIVMSLGEQFGIPLEPAALFEYPTIRALAKYISSHKRE